MTRRWFHLMPFVLLAVAVFRPNGATGSSAAAAAGKALQDEPRQWAVHEIALTAEKDFANPYADVEVIAEFAGPGGQSKKTVRGFWDGERTFKVRFTPPIKGRWKYSIRSQPPDAGLTKSGEFDAGAPPQGSHGLVRRDPKYPYHFIWDDGTRFFLFGQTYYALMERQEKDWKESLDGTARRGMNKVRFCASPKEIGDTTDLAHWKKLDQIVEYLNGKQMLADFLVFNYGTFGKTVVQDERHLRYVLARYAAFPNVVWCLVNEWNYRPKPRDYWNRLGTIVRNEDPWIAAGENLRPLSTHQQTRINWQFFDQTWPTHVIIQYGVRNRHQDPDNEWKSLGTTKYRHGDQWGNAGILLNMGRNMPVVNDEYGYIGEPKDESAQPVQTLTREKHRHIVWGIYAAGGYGSAGDKYQYEDGRPYIGPTVWRDPVEYQDVQHCIEFFTTKGIEYWKMSAHNELVKSGERVYVLAEPARQYVLYAAAGGAFSIQLEPGTYKAWRFDPRTGDETPLPDVKGGQAASFACPDHQDWVFRLTTAAPKK